MSDNDELGALAYRVIQPNILYTWSNGLCAGAEPGVQVHHLRRARVDDLPERGDDARLHELRGSLLVPNLPSRIGAFGDARKRPPAHFVSVLFVVAATLFGAGPAKPQTERTADHPAPDLTAQAGDPTAPLLQLQLTNLYAPSNENGDGYANLLQAQPVVPVPRSSRFPISQVMRLTIPMVTTPGPGRITGLGDISYFDVFVPKAPSWGIWGAGLSLVIPTASSEALGAGKCQLGPAFTAMYYGVRDWQIGAVVQNPVSIAGDPDRPEVNALLIQPIINYLLGPWYIGVGDFTWQLDWTDSGEATIPLGLQVGRITKIGKYDYNLSVELEYTAFHAEEPMFPKWGVRLGVVLLLPE